MAVKNRRILSSPRKRICGGELCFEQKILLRAAALWWFGEGLLGTFFAPFVQEIGGDILDISFAAALYYAMIGVLTYFVGRLSDRFVRKEVLLVAGGALNALFTFGYLFVSKPAHLFAVQAGLGFASALASPPWTALFAKYEVKESSGYTWGLRQAFEMFAIAGAILIGGLVIKYASFTALFISMGIVQTAAAIYQARILKTSFGKS